jgi:hypothetical protein
LHAGYDGAVKPAGLKPAKASAEITYRNNGYILVRDAVQAQTFTKENVGQ